MYKYRTHIKIVGIVVKVWPRYQNNNSTIMKVRFTDQKSFLTTVKPALVTTCIKQLLVSQPSVFLWSLVFSKWR